MPCHVEGPPTQSVRPRMHTRSCRCWSRSNSVASAIDGKKNSVRYTPVISRTIMLHKAIPPARNDHWVGKPYSAGAAGRRRVIARIHRNTLPRNDVGQFKFIDAAPESHARLSAVWPPLIGRVSLRRLAGPIVTLWVIPFRGRARRKPPSIRTHPATPSLLEQSTPSLLGGRQGRILRNA